VADLTVIATAVYNRLKTDSAGSAVRTALGGAARVVRLKDIRKPAPVPPAPFVALRALPAPLTERGVYRAGYEWRIYGDGADDYTITTLAGLITAAYAASPIQYTTGGVVGLLEVSGLGGEAHDETLGLSVRVLSLSVLIGDA